MVQSSLFYDPLESPESRIALVTSEYPKQFTFYRPYRSIRGGPVKYERIFVEPTRMVLLAARVTWELLFRELRDGAKNPDATGHEKAALEFDQGESLRKLTIFRRRLEALGVLTLHDCESDRSRMLKEWTTADGRNLTMELLDAACLVRHLMSESGRGANKDPLWFVNDPKIIFDDFYNPSKKIQLTDLQASMVQKAAMRSLSPRMLRALLGHLQMIAGDAATPPDKVRFVYGEMVAEAQRRLKINGRDYAKKPAYRGSTPMAQTLPTAKEWDYLTKLLDPVDGLAATGKTWIIGAPDYIVCNQDDPLKRTICDKDGQMVLGFATYVENGARKAIRAKGSEPYRDKGGRYARERASIAAAKVRREKTRDHGPH